MDHAHVSYRSHTIFLMLEKGLVVLFPCTARMLGIHSYDVLMSCMWYTGQLLYFPYPYSGLIEMLDSSDPPSATLLMGLSSSIGSLPFVMLPTEPLPEFETYVVSKGISGVVAVNSQMDVYASYFSSHTSAFPLIV